MQDVIGFRRRTGVCLFQGAQLIFFFSFFVDEANGLWC